VPVLFLLDELLSGTNSEDRRAGAAAVLRRLIDTGAIGLATTHDLALTSVADGFGRPGANVHFDERLKGDRLAFDDTLRPGVVRQRNALALTRAGRDRRVRRKGRSFNVSVNVPCVSRFRSTSAGRRNGSKSVGGIGRASGSLTGGGKWEAMAYTYGGRSLGLVAGDRSRRLDISNG
jgi:hypothetical protein